MPRKIVVPKTHKTEPTVTERVEPAAIERVQNSQPVAYVQPALHTILASAQRVAATELAFMARDQDMGARLDNDAAKKLQNLVSAVKETITTEKLVKDEGWGDLSDEEVEAELVKELEALRAKRAGVKK